MITYQVLLLEYNNSLTPIDPGFDERRKWEDGGDSALPWEMVLF